MNDTPPDLAALAARRALYHSTVAQYRASLTSTHPSAAIADSSQMHHLDTLNDDVMSLILQYLQYYDLRSLSCVSQHIRHICCIQMFHDITWTWDSSQLERRGKLNRKFPVIPEGLWGYVRVLTFEFKDSPDTELVVDPSPPKELIAAVPAVSDVAAYDVVSRHTKSADATTTQQETPTLLPAPLLSDIRSDEQVSLHSADTRTTLTLHKDPVLVAECPAQEPGSILGIAAHTTNTSHEPPSNLGVTLSSILTDDGVPPRDIAGATTTTSHESPPVLVTPRPSVISADDQLPLPATVLDTAILPYEPSTVVDVTPIGISADDRLPLPDIALAATAVSYGPPAVVSMKPSQAISSTDDRVPHPGTSNNATTTSLEAPAPVSARSSSTSAEADDQLLFSGIASNATIMSHGSTVMADMTPTIDLTDDQVPLPVIASDTKTTSLETPAVASRPPTVPTQNRVLPVDFTSDASIPSLELPLVDIVTPSENPEQTVASLHDAVAHGATLEYPPACHVNAPDTAAAVNATTGGLSRSTSPVDFSAKGPAPSFGDKCEGDAALSVIPSSPESRRLRYVSDTLLEVLPKMNLQTFHFNGCGYGPWPSLLQALSQISLDNLKISGKPWRRTNEIFDEKSFTFSGPISHFSYLVPFYYEREILPGTRKTLGRRDDTGRIAETYNLTMFLSCINLNLTRLEMPTELIDAMLDVPFPALKELRISGPAPMYSDWIVDIMAQAPELLILCLDIPLQPMDAVPTSFTREFYDYKLMPPLTEDEAGEEVEIEEVAARSIPPKLNSFSLTSPSPEDRIFKHLPASLTTLAFPSYPPPYQKYRPLLRQIPTGAISSTSMFEVLQAVAHLESLTHLELSYTILDFETHAKMIRHIAISFPNLEFLEVHSHPLLDLHGQPGTGLGKDGPSTIDLLKEHLPLLSRLSHLRLNADYPDVTRHLRNPMSRIQVNVDHRIVREHTTRVLSGVESLAEALPSIRTISILKYGELHHYWDIWDISRSSADDKPISTLRFMDYDLLWSRIEL